MSLLLKRRNKWQVALPVLVLYLLIFSVQAFFNFDIAQKPALSASASFAKVKACNQENVSQTKGRAVPVTKLRLNKRFQQENIPVNLPAGVATPVLYAPLKPHFLSRGNLYHSTFLLAYTLRGPPGSV